MMADAVRVEVGGAAYLIAVITGKVGRAACAVIAVSGNVAGLVSVLAFQDTKVAGRVCHATGLIWLVTRRTLKPICPCC